MFPSCTTQPNVDKWSTCYEPQSPSPQIEHQTRQKLYSLLSPHALRSVPYRMPLSSASSNLSTATATNSSHEKSASPQDSHNQFYPSKPLEYMKPEWSQGFFSYPSTRLYQQNPNGYSYEVARTDNDIRWVVTLIRDNRCDQEDNLECQIESVRKYVLGKKRHRNQAISLGMVEALASCLRTAPSKLHRVILQALHEVTTDLEYYPANINDTFFITLASQLIEHPECIRGTLGILCEFTKFDQGKNSAHNAKVAKTLGEVLSSARHNDVLVPTLQVLYNIAEVPTYAGTLVDARIFESFQTVIEERLVEYFQKQMVTDLDDQAAPLMWNIVMTNNKPVREKLVHQVTSECFNYCSRVLDGWSPVMTQWAKVMRLCVNNSEVLEQVKKNFVLNSLVVLRYGESDCVVPLIDTLYNVNLLLAGYDHVTKKPELYYMDHLAVMVKVPFAAHGHGSFFSSSILDTEYRPNMTLSEAQIMLKKCVAEIQRRLLVNLPCFKVVAITKDGTQDLPDIAVTPLK